MFNADNKQRQVLDANNVPIGTYYYDGEGKRVKKVTDTETTVYVFSSGKWVAEYSTAAPPATPTVNYTATDHLGSPRVITDKNGNVVSRRDFMPFGEEIGAGVGTRTTNLKYTASGYDNIRKRYTGYQKDNETQLDFAEARMYQNKHGRFTAVDPLMASASPGDPQTFNRYSYTGNNPANRTDPSGLDWCIQEGTGDNRDIKKVSGRCGDGFETIKPGDGFTLSKGSVRATNGVAGPKDQVRVNADNTVTIITKASEQGSTVNVSQNQEVQNQIQSDPAAGQAVINATISPPTMLELPKCPPGAGCLDASTPSAPSLDIGASADEVLEAADTAATLLGQAPIIGEPIDLIVGGGISLYRGDYTGFTLSVLAAVPGPTGNAAGLAKLARKGAKVIDFVNGNSKLSEKAQHGYVIYENVRRQIVKVGVSGDSITKNGKSYRATRQVSELNKTDPGRYSARIVKTLPSGPGARADILDWERATAEKLRGKGRLTDTNLHSRP